MSKVYESRIVSVNAFGDGILPLPEELIKELAWQLHDKLELTVKGKSLVIRNLSKEERDIKKID